jgi:LytR cell envelope-related transcriptional attenuator
MKREVATTTRRTLISAVATSPFGAARLSRRLTLEQAAARANMDLDAVKSLEDNCIYRFGSNADALAAALVYAASLRISEREARRLAGLPTQSRLDPWSFRRMLAALSFLVTCTALVWFVARPELFPATPTAAASPPARLAPAPLPERWQIEVDVFNGTNVGNAAAGMANQIAGLAYRMGTVGDAKQKNYARTLVYYPPGGEAIAERLAGELGVGTAALPGGDNPRRLVVIVGRRTS